VKDTAASFWFIPFFAPLFKVIVLSPTVLHTLRTFSTDSDREERARKGSFHWAGRSKIICDGSMAL